MKAQTGYFCDVVPVVPIPLRNRQSFSYLSDMDIPKGSLVFIPFGPRTVRGIVTGCVPVAEGTLGSGRFKSVKSVARESFLTDEQMALAESISHECLTSLGSTLRHFLPAIVKERMKPETEVTPATPLKLSAPEKKIADSMRTVKPGVPGFLHADLATALRIVALEKRARKSKSQLLVLVPEVISLPFAEQILVDTFGRERIAVLASRLSAGAYFSAWENIRSGEADVILGTRQALFAPFRSLSHVVVLEEAEILGYKQWDMSPRYDTCRVGETLAGLHGARLILTGSVASLSCSARLKDGTVKALPELPPLARPTVSIVNMREERWKKNYSLISESVRLAIADARARHGVSMLIVSRGGLDSFVVCETCKKIPRCPVCERALRSTRDGHFRCPSCSFKTASFPRCDSCGSLSFRTVGSGTEKVEKEIRRAFPGSKVLRLDEESLRKDKRLKTDALADILGQSDIVIGTPSLLNLGHLPDTSLVAIMDTDNFLSLPDFRGDERFLRMAAQASESASSGNGKGSVIYQTFHPERDSFRHIVEGSLATLLAKTDADRETLGYPPHRALFRIGIRDTDEKKAESTALETSAKLTEVAKSLRSITVSPPLIPLIRKTRGRYERLILIMAPPRNDFPPELASVLLSLSGQWFFEPDPLTIL
ncbi:MAG: primosomal protein N' [Candidatus Moraniibacteriota bacterium]